MLMRTSAFVCLWLFLNVSAIAQDRPNILIIWGDDIGYWNISAYNHGMMGYQTPTLMTQWLGKVSSEGDWSANAAAYVLSRIGAKVSIRQCPLMAESGRSLPLINCACLFFANPPQIGHQAPVDACERGDGGAGARLYLTDLVHAVGSWRGRASDATNAFE